MQSQKVFFAVAQDAVSRLGIDVLHDSFYGGELFQKHPYQLAGKGEFAGMSNHYHL